MLLSIIIPFYNVSTEMLMECMDSIMNQSKPFDVEIIIVDDGSDNFPIFDDIYEFKYIRQDNQGVSVARNRGIREAKGDYLIFIDPDDKLTENAFESFYDAIKRHKETDIILFSNDTLLGNKIVSKNIGDNNALEINKRNIIISVLNHCELYANFSCGSPWAKVFKRTFVTENNLQFVPGLKKCQDRVFMLYAYHKSHNILYIQTSTYCYRADNESSICNRYNPDIDNIMSDVIRESYKFIHEYYSDDVSILDAFEQMKLALTIVVLKLKYLNKNSHIGGYEIYCDNLRSYLKKNKIFRKYSKNKTQISSLQRKFLLGLLRYRLYFPLYIYGCLLG